MKIKDIKIIFFCILTTHITFAIQLPKGIEEEDFTPLIRTLSLSHTTKVLRSAEAYPLYPGLKLSLETTFVNSAKLSEMGNDTSSLPIVIPSTRLNITKGLGSGVEAQFNLSTQALLKTISSIGFLAKWMLIDQKESFASGSVFASFTKLNGFNDDFNSTNFELGFYMSQDYVRIKPYLGMGLILANATVSRSVSPQIQNGSVFSPHLFLGTEIELPMNVAVQLDFTELTPTGSISLGYHF